MNISGKNSKSIIISIKLYLYEFFPIMFCLISCLFHSRYSNIIFISTLWHFCTRNKEFREYFLPGF